MVQINEWVGAPVEVTDEVLCSLKDNGQLATLIFELYRETGRLVILSSDTYFGYQGDEGWLNRNQAICVGLLVRIAKFMLSVAQLFEGHERGEVILALNRSILESVVNLRFLLLKNEDRFYDQFVKFSLGPERELYDLVVKRIDERAGTKLVIEQQMLASIDQICNASGIDIKDVDSKYPDWGGGLRNRLEALDRPEGYVLHIRMPSHAVHGTWVDLLLHHLKVTNSGFEPNPDWANSGGQLLSSVSIYVIEATLEYLQAFFSDKTQTQPFYERLGDLQNRIMMVEVERGDWSIAESAN